LIRCSRHCSNGIISCDSIFHFHETPHDGLRVVVFYLWLKFSVWRLSEVQFIQRNRRDEVSKYRISCVSAGPPGAGFRSICKLMDMPECRVCAGCGYFLPGGACAIAVQSLLCQARGECLAPRIVGSKKYAELLRTQGR